ncbi:MAG: hypothetical protein Q7N50_00220 [Armatimonadota bacterium]|nr:hypothetical protein [Armatimonadota bacterium]
MAAIYRGPNIRAWAEAVCREFAPIAGRHVKARILKKLGTYQPGWPRLAAVTVQRKKSRRKKAPHTIRLMSIDQVGDSPLIDTGEMASGVNSVAKGRNAHITVPYPAQEHEQDSEIGTGGVTPGRIPARPFMVPALEESLDPLAGELETLAALRF